MVNHEFHSVSELRDVESLNLYQELRATMNETDAFKKILSGTRDHARTPMQWADAKYAGFSETEPWIGTDRDCALCNAESEMSDPNSVWNFYRSLIAFRREHSALIYGDIEIVGKKERDLFTYFRSDENETIYVECNLSREMKKRKDGLPNGVCILSNYPEVSEIQLQPYEAAVWKIK